MNSYCVYMHISPSNKKYIGITKQKPEWRWNNGRGYKNNQHFTNAINKYGWDNFQHIIIARGLTEDEAKWLEIELIRVNNTTVSEYGYNNTLGGEGGNGNRVWLGKHHTDESKRKISESQKGENNSMYGKGGKDNPRAKSVICLTTKRIFFTAIDGADYYNVLRQSIGKCCKGKIKSAGKHNGQKLVWRYLNHKHNKTYRVKKEA